MHILNKVSIVIGVVALVLILAAQQMRIRILEEASDGWHKQADSALETAEHCLKTSASSIATTKQAVKNFEDVSRDLAEETVIANGYAKALAEAMKHLRQCKGQAEPVK